ncbi:MAG: hypothetical protein LBP59_08385 [Planctomycetaceae bacterium]|nr:hypothetical protein [Planctomycetaceae bacterium]
MATIQVQVDDKTKTDADVLFQVLDLLLQQRANVSCQAIEKVYSVYSVLLVS